MARKWEVIRNGDQVYQGNERTARSLARTVSRLRHIRAVAREVGSENIVSAGRQWKYVYENGTLVDKGNVGFARYLAGVIR